MPDMKGKTLRMILLAGLFLGCLSAARAQFGRSSFTFLDMANSARIGSMGAEFLSVRDADITLSLANPSLITNEIHNHLAVNIVNYFNGTNYGFASYSRTFKNVGSFAIHAQFGAYGKITATNEFDQRLGTVYANDAAVILGWGRELDSHFTIGANFKMIYSSIESYNAFGMAVDVSATYANSSRLFAVSLLLRNMGGALKSYSGDGYTRMPFEVAVALSQRIPHTPLRIFFEFPNLQKWRLNYEDPYAEKDLITGEVKKRNGAADFFDNLGRHIVVGLELIPYRGFYIRASYNYMRSRDMMQPSKAGVVGFSWGVGFRISKFNISYSRSRYHKLGSPNYISLTLDLDAFNKHRKTKATQAFEKADGK
ncbi:MAG: type IX secretion system protein PorQ [Bacteroides sp.]|nr:type IX secretion system protein PorQ [Ruminococcus flavefaciens]MCM1555633.1 type IX secretion system protein PorQ [Bacteroides sp.]